MDSELMNTQSNTFDSIKHTDDNEEYWFARELGEALGYASWDGFSPVVERAKLSIDRSGGAVENHFRHVSNMVSIGYGNPRPLDDVRLTRYACYIIAQNGNAAKKPKIAEAQAYFATQTRKQEIHEQNRADLNRLARRQEFSEADKKLSGNVIEAGVSPRGLGIIKSQGDQSYFGGKTSAEVKRAYGVDQKKPWADKASNVVLAGKTLANELTAASIEGGATTFPAILNINNNNNKEVRQTIIKQQGTPPEELSPAEDVEKIRKRVNRRSKGLLE